MASSYDVWRKVIAMVKRIVKTAIAILVLFTLVFIYVTIANIQSVVNVFRTDYDQGAYINFVKKTYDSRFHFTGNRNRMPIYPFIQALFYSPKLEDEEFFQDGKQRNVILSIAGLFVIGTVFFLRFSKLFATYAILTIAFLAFAVKSPWFQADLHFYVIFGLAYILSLNSLSKPTWYKSITCGALFALAHLTKASAMPGVVIFATCHAVALIMKLAKRQVDRHQLRDHTVYILAPIAAFIVVMFPYFNESKARYGSYIYNVNTTFYFWYDTWDQVKAGTNAAGDRRGWPDLPDEEIPSFSKYLREHSLSDVTDRISQGIRDQLEFGCFSPVSGYRLGYCTQVILGSIVLLSCIVFLMIRSSTQVIRRNLHIVCFVVLFNLIYALSFIWFMPMSGKGPRTLLSLLIPFFWTLGLIMQLPSIESLHVKIFGRQVQVVTLVISVMTIPLVYEIYDVATLRAANLIGGR